MCGIVGIVGAAPEGYLDRAVRIQSHRGPDNSGTYIDGACGLGHNRLAILDISPRGNQPMQTDDGRYSIVYNGEIYNYRDLKTELEIQGEEFASDTDTEVLLRLFSLFGSECLGRLNGIFAFAVWDTKKQELFIANDNMGVKPVYYTMQGGCFAFASEFKAIAELVDYRAGNQLENVARYMTFLWSPAQEIPAGCVYRLPPGHVLRYREQSDITCIPWFDGKSEFRGKTGRPTDSIIDNTSRLLRQAVHRQLLSDVPVGAFLSGGLDSSAVVTFAREKLPDIPCFTIEMKGGQDDDQIDDLPYAKSVAQYLGVSLNVIEANADSLIRDLRDMVYHLDEPLADPAALNTLHICRAAREAGINVLLSGTAGDDLFSGYRRHMARAYERYWAWLPVQVRRGLELSAGYLPNNLQGARRVRKALDGASKSAEDRLLNYFRWVDSSSMKDLLTPEFKSISFQDVAPMRDYLLNLPSDVSPISQQLALEQRFFLANHNLVYTDKMSMAAGVEVRVPFLDNDLRQFANRIPDKLKIRQGELKWVLKKAMEGYLPHDIIYRKKTGFGVPLRRWIKTELAEFLQDTLDSATVANRGIFNRDALVRLIKQNRDGTRDAAYTLFSALCIELWFQTFTDDRAPASI